MRQIAQRYARALFDLSREAGCLDSVAENLNRLKGIISTHPALAKVLNSQWVGAAQKYALLEEICQKAEIDALVQRTLKVLCNKGRLGFLTEIIYAYKTLLAHDQNLLNIQLISAYKLTKAQIASVTLALEKKTGKKVITESRLDPELLGGVVIKMGSMVIDSSLKGKLYKLQNAMKGGG